jgi:lipoprotein-releasing system permease protein
MNSVRVETWEVRQRKFIAAVEKEKVLVLILFGVISVVAVFLILCIFYMIVVEKTRDIGILKSLGAGAYGVAAVFIIYGAAIGIVGATAGLAVGTVFVHRINEIQDWLAGIHPELRVWRADVYTFDSIPNIVKPTEAAVIFVVAILASALGAVVPAIVAARRQPVEALRYE